MTSKRLPIAVAQCTALCFALLFGSPASSKDGNASHDDLASFLEVFKDTCLATFPTFDGIDQRMKSHGFEYRKSNWRSGAVILHPAEQSAACSAVYSSSSEARDLSDVLQASLGELELNDMNAIRKGIRIDVEFSKNGVDGWLRVEPTAGFTSMVIVLPRERTR